MALLENKATHQPKIAVIMAGGRGTRFWPRSRSHKPKQFLKIFGSEPLLRQTFLRIHPQFEADRIFVATTGDLVEECLRLLPELPVENFLLEPEGRNTAPCLALALVQIERKFPSGVMVVLSADHWIDNADKFKADLWLAAEHAAERGRITVFGIVPTSPEVGYGYIEASGGDKILDVLAFREKPPIETALEYLHSGCHYWNSGMFVWTLADFRRELSRHAPEILAPLDAWVRGGAEMSNLQEVYGKLPKISIDYALLEKATHISMVPASFAWSDVGSWSAAAAFLTPDTDGNVTQGKALVVNSKNCAVFGKTRMITITGLEDILVVDEPDALFIAKRGNTEGTKQVMDKLKEQGRTDLL
jgi:mannose-1-phosphate guanylyltransferase